MITVALLMIVVAIAPSVESTTCNHEGYKKAGCFKRNHKLFTDLLITDLDKTHDKWGKDVDWGNFHDSLHSLACRCYEKAKEDYSYFAIGFYGECWAGSNTKALKEKILNPGSHASSACIGGDYGECNHQNEHECAGIEDNEYVYEVIKEIPSTEAPTTPTTTVSSPWCLQETKVCFGARDNKYGTVHMKAKGFLKALMLVHKSGYVACAGGEKYKSHWGCKEHPVVDLGVYITDNDNKQIFPKYATYPTSTDWLKRAWYFLPGYNAMSPKLVFTDLSTPMYVSEGQEVRIWYGEDLINESEGDNNGVSCVDAYAQFS